jgi:hypothetical protein
VLGLSHRLRNGIELRVEAYERQVSRVRPYWENLIEPFDYFPEALNDRARMNPTRGRARGVELIAEQRSGRRFGWAASYSCAVSDE